MKYLIVGLGNIGDKYANTRHNIGFNCLDYLATSYGSQFESDRFGMVAHAKFRGRNLVLLKPDTFMNLSGNAVAFWMSKLNVPLNHMLIVTDDLNLTFGVLRMRAKGSHGGHNGLKNIEAMLNSQQYPRLRFGISADFQTGKQVDYVLSTWSDEELISLPAAFDKIKAGIEEWTFRGIGMAMNLVNTRDEPQK